MLLGFQRRFVPFILDGSKTHTIRANRKPSKLGYTTRPPRPGQMCHCYVDPRQKTMRLLGRWKCVKVETISIMERHGRPTAVWIDGVALQPDECNQLAWRDGFRTRGRKHAFEEMLEFWEGRLPFEGVIIHWKFERIAARKAGRAR